MAEEEKNPKNPEEIPQDEEKTGTDEVSPEEDENLTDEQKANKAAGITEESEEEAHAEKGEGIKDVQEGIQGGLEDVEMGPVVRDSFLDYAMSVIVSRALPEARDGFKPVQRRIIYAMATAGNTPDKPFKKSARIVGDVMGKYHPHGDSAIYGAMAHLAQDFATRYPLVDGHGNYGNQDGDEPAAMRYTEARLSRLGLEMAKDIGKDTVDFVDTYDGDGKEPVFLPAKFPNLIVNGGTGIAVGMATNIPSHNLSETIDACIALLNNPDLEPADLMEYIKGPDFPGGGIVMGRSGIRKYFETGVGTVVVRGKYDLTQDKNGKQIITFTEIPYMVNKKELAKHIMDLCDNHTIEGIQAVNDYSSQAAGTCFQIDLKKGANAEIVLNHLFKYTALQSNFPVNMLAIDDGQPRVLNMKQALTIFNKFQEDIVTRRTRYDLKKASDRVHILEALRTVHDNIDEVVKIIRNAESQEDAALHLTARFGFDDVQNKAILDMQLRRLTAIEENKILAETEQLKKDIERYRLILSDFIVLKEVVISELTDTKKRYGDARRTEITNAISSTEDEDLIEDEEILVMMTESGYIKRIEPTTFRTQNRGGIGVKGMETKEDDIVKIMIHARTKTDILFFTDKGKVFRVRGYQIPEGTRTSKGLPVVNLIKLDEGEKVLSIISCNKYDRDSYFFFVTKNAVVKRTPTAEFENINSNGKIAISLREGDELFTVKITKGDTYISIGSSLGKVCSFIETDVRPMGRTAAGVTGMNLDGGKVVGVCTGDEGKEILTISENGYGKRSSVEDFRVTARGSKGVLALKVSEKSGGLASLSAVKDDEDVVIITDAGTVMKTRVADIHEANRNTIGVKIITLRDNERISSVCLEPGESDYAPTEEKTPENEEKDESKVIDYVRSTGGDDGSGDEE